MADIFYSAAVLFGIAAGLAYLWWDYERMCMVEDSR